MATSFKNNLREIMKQAWILIKTYGFSKSEALKQAWAILKLKASMKKGVVKFYFKKVDGTIREAWGTLKDDRLPEGKNTGRKTNVSCVPYFDCEKQSWRCFKIANLLRNN